MQDVALNKRRDTKPALFSASVLQERDYPKHVMVLMTLRTSQSTDHIGRVGPSLSTGPRSDLAWPHLQRGGGVRACERIRKFHPVSNIA